VLDLRTHFVDGETALAGGHKSSFPAAHEESGTAQDI
jgi:hypothetical protein